MKSMTTIQHSTIQSPPQLWTPLPESQQEMLSGGAPKITISSTVSSGVVISISCTCS